MNCIIRNAQMKDYHFFEQVKEIKAKKNLDGIELQVNAKIKLPTRCTVITDLRKNPLIWNYCKNYIYLKRTHITMLYALEDMCPDLIYFYAFYWLT